MLKRALSTFAIVAASVFAAPVFAQPTGETTMSTPSSTAYAPINGLELYFEIHGEGSPLVLLHGGVNPSEMFGQPLAEMAKSHKVIAIHLQGHGLTKDVDRAWSFEASADDVAALLEQLDVEKASIMGYSYGAGVALQTAIRHPEIVNRVVAISAAFRSDGEYPEITAAFEQMPSIAPMIAANVSQSPLATMYPDVNWETMFKKTGELHSQRFDWSEPVAGIKAPTLLVFADADSIRPDHIAEFYKLLGGGQRDAGQDGSLRSTNQLAIIPGRTHYNLLASSIVTQVATDFLAQ
jgi:pimeloyl-ACP methyl ester carboxylesterase